MRPIVMALLAFCSLGFVACADGRSGEQDSGVRDARVTDVRFGDLDAARADTWIGTFDAPGLDASLDAFAPEAFTADAYVPPGTDAPPRDAFTAPLPLPYPTRTAMRLKGLQPDFWPNRDEVSGNNTGGVAMNLVWASWEPSVRPPPCAATQEEFDGHCFSVDASVDEAISDWTRRGLVVTAVVYGVPAWARAGHPCSPVSPGFEIFCSPDNAADYGRYAGMLARRYDGLHGHGRLADFVIHNEVNANDWFDIGCGQGTPCNASTWVRTYADSYNAAYDAIRRSQPHAKVLVSLEHHFGTAFDAPSATNPLLSGQTFLTTLAPLIAPRAWRVAYHPYPPDLRRPEFSPDDWPRVTYGNLGTLSQWLRQTFPGVPSTWELQLTESGVNSIGASSEAAQADGVCRSLYNALGTPGVESYIYHRMSDHPVEVGGGLALGLRHADGRAKAAWATWALANRDGTLACGFENLPHIRITRSVGVRGHWASSRVAPPGFTTETSWRVLREAAPGTHMLYECAVGMHNLLTPDLGCEGLHPLGPVGYVYDAPTPGAVGLQRCVVPSNGDHFVSTDPGCEGQRTESTLGYVIP